MAYTAIAAKVYKGPLTLQWANSIKENFENIILNRVAKAWIVFNGTAPTPLDSYNCAVAKNNTGKFRFTFTAPMSATNYSFIGLGTHGSGANPVICMYGSGYNTACTTATIDTYWVASDSMTFRDGQRNTFVVFAANGPDCTGL